MVGFPPGWGLGSQHFVISFKRIRAKEIKRGKWELSTCVPQVPRIKQGLPVNNSFTE